MPGNKAPRTAGVLPTSSTILERLPNQFIVIDDDNVEQWLPVVTMAEGADVTRVERYITRTALAFRLRSSGMSYDDIAAALAGDESVGSMLPVPYGPKQVYDDIAEHIAHLREEVQEALADVVTIEIERFDRMLEALWPAIMTGDTNAINTALRISERRSKLLGLDQPIRIDWRVELSTLLTDGSITIEDVRAQLDEEDFGLFVQYLESRNEVLTHSPNTGIQYLFGDATLAGRFLSLDEGKENDSESESP